MPTAPRRAPLLTAVLVTAALAGLAAGGADAASAMTLSSSAPAPATQNYAYSAQATPVTMTASGTTDGDSMLWGYLDTAADCAPTREDETARSSYVISPGTIQTAVTGTGAFSRDVQIQAPQGLAVGAHTYTVCLYLTRNSPGGYVQVATVAGAFTVARQADTSQDAPTGTLAIGAPSPASQQHADVPGTDGTVPPRPGLSATATGTASAPATVLLLATAAATCAPTPPAVGSPATEAGGTFVAQADIPAGPFSVATSWKAPILAGKADAFGTALVCGYLLAQGPQGRVLTATATAGSYRILPPNCLAASFTVGAPMSIEGPIDWWVPVAFPGRGTFSLSNGALKGRVEQTIDLANRPVNIPLTEKQQFDLQAYGPAHAYAKVTLDMTYQPDADQGGPGSGCVAADGTVVHTAAGLTRQVTFALGTGTPFVSAPGAVALSRILASGSLALPAAKFLRAGSAKVELFLAPAAKSGKPLRIGSLTKTVKKGVAVIFKVRLTKAGKAALAKAGRTAKLTARTTFRPKGGDKAKVTTRKVALK